MLRIDFITNPCCNHCATVTVVTSSALCTSQAQGLQLDITMMLRTTVAPRDPLLTLVHHVFGWLLQVTCVIHLQINCVHKPSVYQKACMNPSFIITLRPLAQAWLLGAASCARNLDTDKVQGY